MNARQARHILILTTILIMPVSCSKADFHSIKVMTKHLASSKWKVFLNKSNLKWGWKDSSGAVVIKPEFDMAYGFYKHSAVVEYKQQWYLIADDGHLITKQHFDYMERFYHGYAVIGLRINGRMKYGYINYDGAVIVAPHYWFAQPWSNGCGLVQVEKWPRKSLWMFVDQNGHGLGTYASAGPFVDGLAPVEIGGRWGFINTKFKVVIKPAYTGEGDFSDGLAAVAVGGKQVDQNDQEGVEGARIGYIDKNGQCIIPPRYDVGYGFVKGYAAVKIAKHWYLINKVGQAILGPMSGNQMFGDIGWSENDQFGTIVAPKEWKILQKVKHELRIGGP